MALSTQASRRYADALADAVAKQGDARLLEVAQELQALQAAVAESKDLQHVLLSPAFGDKEQATLLDQVMAKLGSSDDTQRFVRVLAENGRLPELESVADEVQRLAESRAGKLTAQVQSATPLSDSTKDQLRRALEKRLSRKIDLEIEVDPSLIGGLRAQVGDFLLDGTIKTELERLRVQLAEG